MNILFLCVANSARSQIAEGIARHLFGDSSNLESAGSLPGKLNPLAVQAMSEIGIDISHQYSKSFNDLPPSFILSLDYVITLCAEEVCPSMVPTVKKLHWPVQDPAKAAGTDAEKLESFRFARAEIFRRLLEFQKQAAQ